MMKERKSSNENNPTRNWNATNRDASYPVRVYFGKVDVMEEFFRRAMICLEHGDLRNYLFWRVAFESGKEYAIKYYLP